MLNQIDQCTTAPTTSGCSANGNYAADLGVLDPYRYSADQTPSFSTSSAASSYLSVDGGLTEIVGFNQNASGDYGDFSTTDNVQSAFTDPGGVAAYTAASPEFPMMEAIGYTPAPEPASIALLVTGLMALGQVRRRRQ